MSSLLNEDELCDNTMPSFFGVRSLRWSPNEADRLTVIIFSKLCLLHFLSLSCDEVSISVVCVEESWVTTYKIGGDGHVDVVGLFISLLLAALYLFMVDSAVSSTDPLERPK